MEPVAGSTRPRNVDWKRAAALLYGDWGTSKAYVTGIAFAVAAQYLGSSYASFWLVLAVAVLTGLVGINYIWVCRYFPEGGGVYSSAKQQSRYLALIGAFLLVADYVVTASLSCYDAFLYLNFSFEDAKRWAILTIFLIGVINFFGPRHSGSLAIGFAVATVGVMALLAIACLPHIPGALSNVHRPQTSPMNWWVAFTGVILALSGVEAIANMTGVMQLDPGSSPSQPRVTRTARKAIVPVMLEVCVLTALFGLIMNAIPGIGAREHEGDMLHFLGQKFVDEPLRQTAIWSWWQGPNIFAWTISLVLAGLLLSAVNTAIGALVSILYLLCKDGEMPGVFGMLNRFGVPWIVLLIAMFAPILVIDVQRGADALHGLAAMYGIGVVGAIAVNLGSCAFNFKLPMRPHERSVMMVTFFIIAAIEITIAATKPAALLFAVVVLSLGFLARALHKGFRLPVPPGIGRVARRWFPETLGRRQLQPTADASARMLRDQLGPERRVHAIMVAARGVTPTLRFAIEEARVRGAEVFVLFVREQLTTIPVPLIEEEDEEAQAVFRAARSIAGEVKVTTIYAVSDDATWTILDNAAIAGVDMLILGHSRRTALTRMLRGDLLARLGAELPEEIRLMIVS
jgi:amino acid transporter